MPTPFTHLHVHSEYSLLDGSAKIKELASRTKELGMDSIALTDHGVMYGIIDFYKAVKAEGLKPILGCEAYVASGSRTNKENTKDNFYYHIVLLAENDEGYHNLVKLVSHGFTDGFYYKPRIDVGLLRKYHRGIIALSACLGGPVAKNILDVSYEEAKKQALLYSEIFGEGNFYLELQDHGMTEQKKVNAALLKMSRELNIPLVCTNDTHYIYNTDAKAHEILLCIQTGKTIQDEDRMIYEGEQFYLKSPEEMQSLFGHVPEALANTSKIAGRCNVEIRFNEYKLPKFKLDEGVDSYEYLRGQCMDGIRERYGDVTDVMTERLEYELSVINSMGFVDYFLIVWDFIKYARDNGIIVGPGRGSGTGSIVAYSLRITNIEPLRYDLIFERFLNPERISMPDFDVDFCYVRRQEVIDYVVGKYGADHVAQIIAFGTMAARGVVRDVGRALGMSYGEVDKIAKMIPFALKMTIDLALNISAGLKTAYDGNPQIKYLIDMAKRLEGLPRHASTHAAGVVICDSPVTEYVPLNRNGDIITTQFPKDTVEALGLLKMDFLGLRTLTVIQSTVSEVNRKCGLDIDIDKIDQTDPKVFDLIAQAKTEGIFQLESSGMKSFMKELKPACLEDMIAGISLYRPGPMDSIPKYIRGRNNPGLIEYTHPALEPILKDTYGCIVYQEQVMQIVRDLAGYSIGRSDLVRSAMSKKKAKVMAEERRIFIHGTDGVPGCVANGIPEGYAERIFNDMSDFASYGFNKSHAAGYAIVGYQTAWLKTYYPAEFMSALFTSVMDRTDKIAEYINECKKMGQNVLPPDINEGTGDFTATEAGIRFGLKAIKNVGRGVVSAIVSEREQNGRFKSLTDFINRMSVDDGDEEREGGINKRCLESLIRSGAFSSFGGKRSQYMAAFIPIMDSAGQIRKRTIKGQISLFDIPSADNTLGIDETVSGNYNIRDELPDIPEYTLNQILSDEKSVLGIYVSGHPINEYEDEIKRFANVTSLDFNFERNESEDMAEELTEERLPDGKDVVVGGIIVKKSIKYTKKDNNAMAFVTVEDLYGEIEVILFPKVYDQNSLLLEDGKAVLVYGRASVREDEAPKVVCSELRFLKKPDSSLSSVELWLKIPKEKDGTVRINDLLAVLANDRGPAPVVIYKEANGERLRVNENYWVNAESENLIISLKGLLGDKSVVMKTVK